MDTGQVLAGRDMYAPHPQASTIKTLLALTALDEVDLNAHRGGQRGRDPGGMQLRRGQTRPQLHRAPVTRRRAAGVGERRGEHAGRLIGGYQVAVDKMNAKAAAIGATNTHATSPSGLERPGGPGWTTPHDLAAIFRAAMANPVVRRDHRAAGCLVPHRHTGDKPLVNQDELLVRYPGAIGGKTGFTDAARKTFVGADDRDGRRLVIAMMYGLIHEGGPTYWDQAAMLLDWGLAQGRSESVAAL